MDPLRISAIGPVALSALKPPQPPAPPTAQASAGLPPVRDLVQGLAQDLFQRSLQTGVLFPVAESGPTPTDLMPGFTGSLLAALSAPQAPATVTPTPDATIAPATLPAPDTASAPIAAVPGDLPATQDTLAASSSLEFALQTALRFGAGVVAQALPAPVAADLGTGLVRDAMAVPRIRNLQPHAGGPGPEAFARPEATQRALRSYQVAPATEGLAGLDLMV